ncbi:MAG TPA: replication initiation protein [Gammaproteobacteria bacterium]|nr:replication initiation protein [Gammaproteobacteria bacterium]
MPSIPKNLVTTHLLLSSSMPLTLSDRRLYNYLLLHALPQLKKTQNFTLPLAELKGVYGTNIPLAMPVKESLRRLLRTLIEFQSEPQKWIVTSLLEHGELDEQKQELHYAYSDYCCWLFTQPLTLEKCLIQAHFTQKYSNLLYEILSQAHFANQKTLTLEATDLRDRLLTLEKKFSNFGDFKRFVLMPALYEINAYASFAVKFHLQKKGMKVTHVMFEMTPKRKLTRLTDVATVIPPKRPIFFIDNPELEKAYSYLLNADTPLRRKLFNKAIKAAKTTGIVLDEEAFDCPDVWFDWVQNELLNLSQ